MVAVGVVSSGGGCLGTVGGGGGGGVFKAVCAGPGRLKEGRAGGAEATEE